jgi:hypothetical protein
MRLRTTAVILTILCSSLSGCKKTDEEKAASRGAISPGDVKAEVVEAADVSLDYAAQKKEEYENAIASKLADLDEQLAELKSNAQEAEQDVREEVLAMLNNLEARRQEAQRKLEAIQAEAPDAWEDLKAGLDAALEDLDESYEQAKSRFE